MLKRVSAFILLAAVLGLQTVALAGSAPKLAIKGYDVVAYFTANKPTLGAKAFEHVWQEQTWRFASKENLELFKQAPEKYAPQYGANCAWAVGHNYTAPSDPEAWEIVNGKLYLNYNKDVQKKWREKRDEYIASGDKNWPELHAKEKKEE
ncbi:MAG: YHS domain-containing (seleno)protein [candidate division KSB1 bacterium]